MAKYAPGDRRPPWILGASLKLYMDVTRTAEWADAVAGIARGHESVRSGAVRLFVLPSLPALPAVEKALARVPVEFGAQDLHWEDRGAFTGAVSGADLYEVGCRLVAVGHAERKNVFGETDEVVGRKFRAALRNGLTPVFCVGEPFERTPEDAASECIRRIDSAFAEAELDGREVIVAYEPEWAIGAPEPASSEHVCAVVATLRERLASETALRSSAVIYGGSAQRGTLTALADSVDGLFLGRFAHDADDFAAIVDEAVSLR